MSTAGDDKIDIPLGMDTERPYAPGFPRLTVPRPAYNDNPQLHFDTFLPRLLSSLNNLHNDIARQQRVEFEQAVILQCLMQVLMDKGLVSKAELDAHFPNMAAGLEVVRSNMLGGPTTARPPADAVEPVDLDCNAHHAVCDAACCTSFNVFLTADEAASNKYLWDVAMPYRLLVDDDGRCVYFDNVGHRCTIWQDRPAACRNFDCRDDGRIWDDYASRNLSSLMMDSKARQAAARQREREAKAKSNG